MTGLTWLHLSDWHQNNPKHQKGKGFNRRVVRDKLIEDIKERRAISSDLDNVDCVIFSGDLACHGKDEEYRLAKKELLDPILSACELSNDRLFIVPGNHDLDRDSFKYLPAVLLNPQISNADVQDCLMDEKMKSRLLEPFEFFSSFVEEYTSQENPDYASIRQFETDGRKVALFGINSAWMCGRNKDADGKFNDKGHIFLGEPQIKCHLKEISKADIKIAILHHPLDWLSDFGNNQVKNYLVQEFDFILHGHLHKPDVVVISGPSGDYANLPAGACYDSRHHPNSYNFIHLDFKSGSGAAYLRCWNGREWREDIDSCPKDKGVYRFNFSGRLSVRKPPTVPNSIKPVSGLINSPNIKLLDRLTEVTEFDSDRFKIFREQLRDDIKKTLSNELDPFEFLTKANLMVNGRLTYTGVLMFGKNPTLSLSSAITQCVKYYGPSKSASREPQREELNKTIPEQIEDAHKFIASRIEQKENPIANRPSSITEYEYPMICVREIIANALVHRDYEDSNRIVHINLFTDRIEVKSPGRWSAGDLGEGELISLKDLRSNSIKRNIRLATALSWIKFVEGEGSGIPTAISDCEAINAPIPNVIQKEGFIIVTIWPSRSFRKSINGMKYHSHITPRQIPPSPPDFVGREREISNIRTNFECRGVILGIYGLGGIGKTALACKLAEDLRDRYPNGQLMVDLQGTGRRPMKPVEAMVQVIRSFDPIAHLPNSETALANIYRSILYDKHILLLLDNALDDRQVRPLLPPLTCDVLITSRKKFTLPGLQRIDLDTLEPLSARYLLLAIDGRISDCADDLAKLCGYLPLALRAAGSLLKNNPDLDPYEYLEELRAERTRLERLGSEGVYLNVEASFNLSYGRLPDDVKRVFKMASAFPADFDAKAEEEVCMDEGHRLLSELVLWSLVDYLKDAGRYRLHDLVRMFAAIHLEKENDEKACFSAHRQHAEHYRKVLSHADELYRKGGKAVLAGLKLFDLEWANIRTGRAWAESIALSNNQSTTSNMDTERELSLGLCISYLDAGDYVLSLRLHPYDLIHWLKTALVAARQLKDRRGEGAVLGNLGIAFKNLGDSYKSLKCHGQSLDIAREIGDRRGEGNALSSLGVAYKNLGEYRKAIELEEQALTIAKEIGNRRGEGTATNRLGMVYKNIGEYKKALDLHTQALAIAKETGNRRGEGTATNRIGIAYKNLGEYKKALESHEQALAIAREIGDRRGEGAALCNIGRTYRSLGEYSKAIEFYKQHLAIAREIGDKRGEGAVLGSMGIAYYDLGEYRKAIESHDQSLVIAKDIGDRRREGNALWNMSLALDKTGDRKQAIDFAKLALKIRQDIESPFIEEVSRQLDEWQR